MTRFRKTLLRRLYYRLSLRKLEDMLESHPTAKKITGANLVVDGRQLDSGLVRINDNLEVDAETFGRLFMLQDGAVCKVSVQKTPSLDEAPPGIYIKSTHDWILDGHENSVGLYSEVSSRAGVFIDGVFVDHIFFNEDRPPQLGAVSFGLLALTAYELGYDEITLLAGGGAPKHSSMWALPDMIGYMVWPKFGFDAPLEIGETANAPHLSGCRTVNEVRGLDLDWWEKQEGNGRVMTFDLSPWSESWKILLNYISNKKEFL